jgi:hypothetical protein
MRLLIALLCLGCGCPTQAPLAAPPPDAPAARPASAGGVRPASILDRWLAPWHHIDPRWEREADVILVGVYTETMYPHVTMPDGTHEYPLARMVTVTDVLKGRCTHRTVNFRVPTDPSLDFPPLIRNRRIAVFLHPSAVSRRLLEGPDVPYSFETELAQAEVVAVVDLDQTEAEALAHRRRLAPPSAPSP